MFAKSVSEAKSALGIAVSDTAITGEDDWVERTSKIQDILDSGDVVLPSSRQSTRVGRLIANDGLRILFGIFRSAGGLLEFIKLNAKFEGIKLFGVKIDADSKVAINHNVARADNISIVACDVKSSGYGILSNRKAGGSRNFLVAGSCIESTRADAIEWNHPDQAGINFSVIGNFLEAGISGKGKTSGFAVGVAGTDGHLTVGNHIRNSRNEAIHVEDSQSRGVVALNTVEDTQGDAMRILPAASAQPIVVLGNWMRRKIKGSAGVYIVNDGSGILENNVAIGNVVENFETGYRFVGSQMLANSLAIKCDYALSLTSNPRIFGGVHAVSCPVLVRTNAAGRIDSLSSSTPVDRVIEHRAKFGFGFYARSLRFPFAIGADAALTEIEAVICERPDFIRGDAILSITGPGFSVFHAAKVEGDESAFLISGVFERLRGNVLSVKLTADNSSIKAVLNVRSPIECHCEGFFEFDGIFLVD